MMFDRAATVSSHVAEVFESCNETKMTDCINFNDLQIPGQRGRRAGPSSLSQLLHHYSRS